MSFAMVLFDMIYVYLLELPYRVCQGAPVISTFGSVKRLSIVV